MQENVGALKLGITLMSPPTRTPFGLASVPVLGVGKRRKSYCWRRSPRSASKRLHWLRAVEQRSDVRLRRRENHREVIAAAVEYRPQFRGRVPSSSTLARASSARARAYSRAYVLMRSPLPSRDPHCNRCEAERPSRDARWIIRRTTSLLPAPIEPLGHAAVM
jgi:hypothetical protein